ncbi:MAG: ArsC/Spx/MgsR family protein [Pseudomonadota bacterium]
MEIELYGIKTCDTCKKALAALRGAGLTVAFIDVRDAPLSREKLAAFEAAFGDKLLNTRSTTWRGLSEQERGEDPIDLLIAHPTLMKRPVVMNGAQMTIGWDKRAQATWLEP